MNLHKKIKWQMTVIIVTWYEKINKIHRKYHKVKLMEKKVKNLRDTGCTCMILKNILVKKENLINEYCLMKIADKNIY